MILDDSPSYTHFFVDGILLTQSSLRCKLSTIATSVGINDLILVVDSADQNNTNPEKYEKKGRSFLSKMKLPY